MHAVISYNTSIADVLSYHEEKVSEGKAELVSAGNFIREAADLDLREKRYHFDRLTALNDTIKKNILHVFMRFGQTEKVSNDTMAKVATDYLKGMGFGNQPFLVYRHMDTPVPHAHLVSTTVNPAGNRINIQRAELYHSKALTSELEKQYGLQPNSMAMAAQNGQTSPKKIDPAGMPLYPAMSNVLESVVPTYHYTNLSELNAVLGLYNMTASRGTQRSVTYRKNGLHYLPLKSDGHSTTAYITASAFPSKPTLANLQIRFAANQALREPDRRRLSTSIDYALAGQKLDFNGFQQAMARERITVVAHKDNVGNLQTICYVDHHTKAVFEGNALGHKYAAPAIQQRCLSEQAYKLQQKTQAETHRQEHRLHL